MAVRGTGTMMLSALVALLAAGAVASPALARRLSDRPPPAHTGGFGEPTCHVCHFDSTADDGRGTIRLEGLPPVYEPGAGYVLTVSLSHPDLRIGGFQLSARFSQSVGTGRQAGTLRALDERVDVTGLQELPVQYARHTGEGVVPDSLGLTHIQWRVEWSAPSEGGTVVFHIATNVANDDASPLGDFVYTKAFEGKSHRK